MLSALTLESLHLFPSGTTGGLRSGLGSVSTCRASSGRCEPAGSSGTTPFPSPRATFFTLDLDQRLRLDPSPGSSDFSTRVSAGAIRREGALALSSRHRSVKRKRNPHQNILISPRGCLLIFSCQIPFHDCGLFHFAQRAAFLRLPSALSLTGAQCGCRLGEQVVPTLARLESTTGMDTVVGEHRDCLSITHLLQRKPGRRKQEPP